MLSYPSIFPAGLEYSIARPALFAACLTNRGGGDWFVEERSGEEGRGGEHGGSYACVETSRKERKGGVSFETYSDG